MSRQYFGTDGVRGKVGEAPMTPEFALKLGWAAGRVLGKGAGGHVIVGKDTRRSGYMFESALEAGFAAAGMTTDLLGPLPTPGVAYLTRALRANAGVVISASHNPHHDNGVKFFDADGRKLSDEIELEIERLIDAPLECVAPEQLGRAKRIEDAAGRYIEFCKGTFTERNLNGMKLVVDCANGAAYRVAPAVFTELGADVVTIGDQPNGLNINAGCGSTHLDALKAAVQRSRAALGIAFDGDADRCLMVDGDGNEVDGDQILYVIAQWKQQRGDLRGPVVGTQMSNLGLERALSALGIEFLRARVGDRYVMEMLRSRDGMLGGEGSGHTICLDKTTTGDGLVTALQVLTALRAQKKNLADAVAAVRKFPQVLINVPVRGRATDILGRVALQDAETLAAKRLGARGRVLLRASGTEPLIRVMVEADDQTLTHDVAQSLAAVVAAQG